MQIHADYAAPKLGIADFEPHPFGQGAASQDQDKAVALLSQKAELGMGE